MNSIFFGFITVFLLSMLKCILGPMAGLGLKLPLYIAIIANFSGMLSSVIIFSFAGDYLKQNVLDRFFPSKNLFSKKNRRIVVIWKKYGLLGVAFLTPILLMPIGGTLIAASFGEKPLRIISFMFFSMLFWSITLTYFVYEIKQMFI